MTERVATCRCGQLQAICASEPVRISVCHCLDCQRRSGSAFAVQARFSDEHVRLAGETREWSVVGENGKRATFRFCPVCGSTVSYTSEAMPGMVAVAVGAFGDPNFPPPSISGYEERRHPWVRVVDDGIEHFD
jgi:hypothetical protein